MDAVEAVIVIVILYGSDDRVVWVHGAFRHYDFEFQSPERRRCLNGMVVLQPAHGRIVTDARPGFDAVEFRVAGFDAVGNDAIGTDAMENDAIVADAIEAAVELSVDVVKSKGGDGVLPDSFYGYGTGVAVRHTVAFHIEAAAPGQSSQSHPFL